MLLHVNCLKLIAEVLRELRNVGLQVEKFWCRVGTSAVLTAYLIVRLDLFKE